MISLNTYLNEEISPLRPLSNTDVILTKKYSQRVGIDWLSLHFEGVVRSVENWTIKKRDGGTAVFSAVHDLYYNSELIGVFTSEPKSSILSKAMVLFKFDNHVLYKFDVYELSKKIIKDFGLVFRNISRIDIFTDFNKFDNGLNPHNLIKRYLSGSYTKKGKGKFHVIGNNGSKLSYDYLKIGSNNSDISVYLYNKTKELIEVKDKPYIRQFHKDLGLNTNETIWRLEVSIKSSMIDILSNELCNVSHLTLEFIKEFSNVSSLYYSCIEKYFTFYENWAQVVKSRNRKLELFNRNFELFKLSKHKCVKNSTKVNKLVVKKLYEFNSELRFKFIDGYFERDNVLSDYIATFGLEDYFNDKIKDSDITNCLRPRGKFVNSNY